MSEQEQLERSIAQLEAQRAVLGDSVVEAAVAPLRDRLAQLKRRDVALPRTQATVLCVQVPALATLSDSMGPENAGAMTESLWTRLSQVVSAHGGRLDAPERDSVTALWDVEGACEEDREQAIRAALAMQAEMRDFKVETTPAVPLQMHIGVNSGPVLLHADTAATYDDTAGTIETARRLAEAAPPDGILVSHESYRAVRGVFDVRPQDPLPIGEDAAPVQVYLVDGAKPRTFPLGVRGVEGIETRMIGRDAELEHLQQALQTVMHGRKRQMITIVGCAGVGKSRLLYEFATWMELLPEEIYYFKGRAFEETQNQPYALIRDLLTFRFEIQDSDQASVVREKMERGLGEAFDQDDADLRVDVHSHFIGQLIGLDLGESPHLQEGRIDAQEIRDRAHAYLSDYLNAVAGRWPVAILLEDIHWADDSSLDALNRLASMTSDQSLLIVCSARPALFERRPNWGEDQVFHTRLELGLLSKQSTRHLVGEILRKLEAVPDALSELVVSKAGGNPLCVEEVIKILVETGVIVKGEDRWWVDPVRLTTVRVPDSLPAVLKARMDSLSPEERIVLQCSSIIGGSFWADAVQRMCAEPVSAQLGPAVPDTDQALASLCRRELIFPRKRSAFVATQEYIFKHPVLRKITKESLSDEQRQVYHARAGAWLRTRSGDRAVEYAGVVADHLELAGQTEQAIACLAQAGEQAVARFAPAEAVDFFSRALKLLPRESAAERYALLLAREKAYEVQGDHQLQAHDLSTLQALAEELADVRRQIEVRLRRADYAESIGDYSTASAVAEAAIQLLKGSPVLEPEATQLEAMGYLYWGRSLWRLGAYEEAQRKLEHALSLSRTASLPQYEADALRAMGNVALVQSVFGAAKAHYMQALRLCREIGDRRGESGVLNNLGALHYHQGEYLEAKGHYEPALRIGREIGDRRIEGATLVNLGLSLVELGDYVTAKPYLEQALAISREVANRWGQGVVLGNLALIFHRLGNYDRARDYYTQALRTYLEIGDRQSEGRCRSSLSLLFHHLGDHHTAREYSLQAQRLAQELGDRHTESFALTHLGHALMALDQCEEAVDAYEQALSIRQSLEQENLVMETTAGLAEVALRQQDLDRATSYVEQILAYLETRAGISFGRADAPESVQTRPAGALHGLAGTEEPFRVYLTCYRVLQENRDPRAGNVLETAHHLLQEQARLVQQGVSGEVGLPAGQEGPAMTVDVVAEPALASTYLTHVAAHREIIEEHSQRS